MSTVELEVVISIDAVVLSTFVSGFCIFKSVCILVFGFGRGEKVVSVLPLFLVFGFVDTAVVFAAVIFIIVVVTSVVDSVSVVVVLIVVVFFVVSGAIVLSCVVLKFNFTKSYGSKK